MSVDWRDGDLRWRWSGHGQTNASWSRRISDPDAWIKSEWWDDLFPFVHRPPLDLRFMHHRFPGLYMDGWITLAPSGNHQAVVSYMDYKFVDRGYVATRAGYRRVLRRCFYGAMREAADRLVVLANKVNVRGEL